MAQIQVKDLTFSYDVSADDILKDVSFNIDTDWKLGLIGCNGDRQCALKGASHSGQETPTRQVASHSTGSEFCVVRGNAYYEA